MRSRSSPTSGASSIRAKSIGKGRPDRLTSPLGGSERSERGGIFHPGGKGRPGRGSERVSPTGRPEGEHPSAKHADRPTGRGGTFHPSSQGTLREPGGSPARRPAALRPSP